TALGRRTVASYRSERTAGRSAATTDRISPANWISATRAGPAAWAESKRVGGQRWWRQHDGRHRYRQYRARRDHHEPGHLRHAVRILRGAPHQLAAIGRDLLLLQRRLAAADLHHESDQRQ